MAMRPWFPRGPRQPETHNPTPQAWEQSTALFATRPLRYPPGGCDWILFRERASSENNGTTSPGCWPLEKWRINCCRLGQWVGVRTEGIPNGSCLARLSRITTVGPFSNHC